MNPNLGSGNSILGGGNDALSAAIARRNTGQGSTTPQTPASAGFDPALMGVSLPERQGTPTANVSSTQIAPAQVGSAIGMPSATAWEN